MIFNNTFKLANVIPPLSQDEIYNTPEYYAMSREQILDDPTCPMHLKLVLNSMPWIGRPSFVQVRPQDFRGANPHILGTGWHVDVNTALTNGRMHLAKSLDEFRSMVVSFGDVCETQFIGSPIDIDSSVDPFDHCAFATAVDAKLARTGFHLVTTAPDQVAVYTSRDIHRAAPNVRPGKMRLIIVSVELDEDLEAGAGQVRPSIKERGR